MEYNQFWSFIDEVNQETEPWDNPASSCLFDKIERRIAQERMGGYRFDGKTVHQVL